jgi:hypothetical protein
MNPSLSSLQGVADMYKALQDLYKTIIFCKGSDTSIDCVELKFRHVGNNYLIERIPHKFLASLEDYRYFLTGKLKSLGYTGEEVTSK